MENLSNSQEIENIEDKLKSIRLDSSLLYKSTDKKEYEDKLESPNNLRNLNSNDSSNFTQNDPNTNTNYIYDSIHSSTTCNMSNFKENITPNNNTNNNIITQTNPISEFQQLKNTIHQKIISITNLHYFLQNYVNDISTLYNKIDSIIFKKVTLILDKHKYYLRFFKEITTLYETFSINLLHANNTINLHFKEEDDNCPFQYINNTVDKSQELISNSFYDFSKNLQNKIINKGNIKEFYDKMGEISKMNNINDIIKKRDKLSLKFQNFAKIFESFKKSYNDPEKLLQIFNKNEFFIIEFEYCNSVNKLFKKIEEFFDQHKNCLIELKLLTENFINSLKEKVDIYVQESKKMFLIEDMDIALDKIKIEVNSLDSSIRDILLSSQNNFNFKIINDSLKTLQTNLQKFRFIKSDSIYNESLFNIENYNSFEDLNEFMIKILPEKLNVLNSNLIVFICDVNQIYGLFNSSKNCVMLITLQNSVMIFEQKVNKKLYERFSMKNLKFRNCEDKRHPLRFELAELKLGMIYNSTVKITLEVDDEELYKIVESLLNKKN